MLKTKSFILGLFSAIIISGNSYALNSKTDFSITLENNPKTEFQLAKSTFLPETFDDLGLSGRDNTKYNHNTANKCIGYNLSSCPTNAICSQCPSNSKMFKFSSCESGYKKSGNSCKSLSCSDLGYVAEIPTNKVCTAVTSGSLSCYKDCQSVSCDEYTINCDSFNVTNSAGKEVCPVCNNANANCSPKRCKVSACLDGYKVASDGKSCIAMDDACPDGYYKECETGTTGEPEYTELGTACYKCKAKVETVMLPILYSDMTTSTGVNSGKTPIGVVFDEDKKLAVALDSLTKVWATSSFDIPDLSTYSTAATALSDWNGKANTKNINSFCQANDKSCPASEYAMAYTTKGTFAGDWYIPALGELNAIYTKLPSINTTLERINGTILPTETYWSSSKYNTNGSIWNHYFGNGNAYHGNSGYNLYLRLVINYGNANKDLPILYSDLTTSTEVISGKTPIGVVFDESKKLAVALKNSSLMTWMPYYVDIPAEPDTTSTSDAIADWRGKLNTSTIIDFCKTKSKSCPAAEYAYGYKTAGTSSGDWYLPGMGELNALYLNKAAVNEAITKVKGTVIPNSTMDSLLWSSSEQSYASAWKQYFSDGSIDKEFKSGSAYVRPVINYGDVNKVCTPITKCPTEISKVYSTPTYKVHKYQYENGCGGSLTCYREKSCDEACPPAQTPSCPCTDSWGNQSTTCSDENIQKCRETCLEHCNKYPSDECWWIGCAYTNI